jgi:hypothetical protein
MNLLNSKILNTQRPLPDKKQIPGNRETDNPEVLKNKDEEGKFPEEERDFPEAQKPGKDKGQGDKPEQEPENNPETQPGTESQNPDEERENDRGKGKMAI